MRYNYETKQRTVTYTLPVRTEKEIKEAEKTQKKAYKQYNSVTVTPYGLDHIQIICTQ